MIARPLLAFLCAIAAAAAHGADPCGARADLLDLGRPLAVSAERAALATPLRILAIGSSSTAGEGASMVSATFPAVLARELARLRPGKGVAMINAGVNGDTAIGMHDRLEREVIAADPQLVLWQTGANDAMRGVDPERFERALVSGVRLLRSRAIDVVLVPPQYAPAVERAEHRARYIALMRKVAADEGAGFFERYDIMRETARADPRAAAALIGPDGLHHTDLGYRCLGEQLARAIDRAIDRVGARAQ